MVHKVIPEIDAGETILSEQIPIEKEDSLQLLEEKVHKVEHRILVQAIKQMLSPSSWLVRGGEIE